MPVKRLIVERDVEMVTHDGAILRADVYRPSTSKPLPVLLQRTPYNKSFSSNAFALMAAEAGYAVVVQDTRGRWASDGSYYPFLYEMNDGYDSVEWASQQPWANGRVGMFGGSYVGYTQLAAAAMHPPSLQAIAPAITFCQPYVALYSGGALALGVGVSWPLMNEALPTVLAMSDGAPEKQERMEALIAAVDGMARGDTFRCLPLDNMPLIGGGGFSGFFSDVLAHPVRDQYWERTVCPYESISIPALHIGGWYDNFASNTLGDFAGIWKSGNTSQKVLMGPWFHGVFTGPVGEVDFGLQASAVLLVPDQVHLRWFDYWLKDIDNGIMEEPPIRIFVMGDDRWRYENEWPLARTRNTPYYLHSGGTANGLQGDGTLSLELPADEPVDSFVYDPRNPVPTRGGALCCWSPALPAGAFDQRPVEARPDVLVYSTPRLKEPLEVIGPVEVRLWAASTAPDTDFTAKLVDVSPCGYARNVQDGIVRTRHHRQIMQAEPVRPNEAYEYSIDLAATGNVFLAGHRIRLEISSSNFPRFDRNSNSGHPLADSTEVRAAVQTILHDAEHPSHIIVPVIPR